MREPRYFFLIFLVFWGEILKILNFRFFCGGWPNKALRVFIMLQSCGIQVGSDFLFNSNCFSRSMQVFQAPP